MKNRKLIASGLILFILILSFSSFINVGYAADPNVELISEAGITTRWDFVNETAGFDILYFEPFDNASSYWNLYDVLPKVFQKYGSDKNNYLLENYSFISEWSYSGDSYYIGDKESYPSGICFYDGYWYMTGENYRKVWKYNPDWTYTGTSWGVGGVEWMPTDLYYHDGYWWLLGDENPNQVHKFYLNWTHTGTSYTLGGQDSSHLGICYYDGYWWTVGNDNNKVFKYYDNWTYTGSSFPIGAQETYPTGIYFKDGYWYLAGFGTCYVHKYNSTWDYVGIEYNLYPQDHSVESITYHDGCWWMIGKDNDRVYKYNDIFSISKSYQGSGILYCQTNITETLTLRSPNNLSLTLQEGDKIEIKFNTSSANRIDFNLRNNSIQQASYILSIQGNGDFSNRIKAFTVSSNISVDQMEFTGSFEDTKNLIVDYVKVFRSFSDVISYYVEPYGRRELDLGHPHNYTVEIYEHDDLKEIKYITTSATLQTLIYERIDGIIVYINYFNANNEYLDFNNYITYVNYTLDNSTYTNKRLSSNILYADENTQIYFKIYDSFNALIKTMNQYEETFIDITLDVYSLKIKNEYQDYVFYELKNNDTEIIKSGNIFSQEIIEYSLASGIYVFNYTKDGDEESVNIDFLGHQILVINSSKMCFLTYVNQQGEYLFFNNYKTYVDGSLIYYNVFYRDVGDNISVEIKDLYDISVKNHSYIVVSGDNYIPVVLTLYSLKVMSQQLCFNHINITRDPAYYTSSYYWSEWIAPSEIIEFKLFAGYYKINLTDNENGGYSFYSYTLNGDDVLLIGSNNTIYNVLVNIANVNATLGNQITNVEINITNQNSNINNTIISISINLDNVNSTLGDLLIDINTAISNINSSIINQIVALGVNINNINTSLSNQILLISTDITNINSSIINQIVALAVNVNNINVTITDQILSLHVDLTNINASITNLLLNLGINITNMANSIGSLYMFTNNSFINLNNVMNTSFIYMENNIIAINQSISNLVIGVSNDIYLINGTISTMISQLETNLLLMNVSIDTSLFNLNTTLNLIGSNITSNYILLNNTLNLIDINVNDSRIAIINNLLLVNNTISTLIANVYSAVYLINNSIYTAVVDLGTYLSLVNNTIYGNLSIVLQMNEFLTELYQMTMFSDLLNWTNIGLNISLLTSQIDAWTFVNNYINQSIEVHLRYQDIIEKLVISADDSIEQYLPSEDVEYRLWSVDDEKYIDEWEELDPKNKTVNFGFFEMEVPIIPEPLEADNTTIISTIMIFSVIGAIIVISWQIRKGANRTTKASTDGRYVAFKSLDKRKIGLAVLFIILISVIILIFIQILIK